MISMRVLTTLGLVVPSLCVACDRVPVPLGNDLEAAGADSQGIANTSVATGGGEAEVPTSPSYPTGGGASLPHDPSSGTGGETSAAPAGPSGTGGDGGAESSAEPPLGTGGSDSGYPDNGPTGGSELPDDPESGVGGGVALPHDPPGAVGGTDPTDGPGETDGGDSGSPADDPRESGGRGGSGGEEPTPELTCVVAGCSSQLCVSNEAGAGFVSTCEWLAEYACYETAQCEVQADGTCGWTPTAELQACVAEARNTSLDPDPCAGAECGDPCSPCDPGDETCLTVDGTCNADGECTTEVPVCPDDEPLPSSCVAAGCSLQYCVSEEEAATLVTTCEWRDEYACYGSAACELQADGACAWTMTDELQACILEAIGGDDEPEPDPCAGAQCGDSCTTCDPSQETCPAVVESCNANGECTTEVPVCPGDEPCVPAGCSGQYCLSVDEASGFASTCEWLEVYACFREATCELQADGACGWTETPEFASCIAAAAE